ncbi:vanadium-dependent haloperoxidase [Bradyrhizobium sp. LHD-71]|uniref:vanadium-dependent haloperoxidase n=1 Tax=Bradyrhizobium sp. LHD-71 TaxID=3072141 RepID=UPI00280F258B|nr:vanadium-dependent haloperoxidase [Bradyrhizobium sp. LHD-71]MDQ8732160.1 vanadium-dependent haloperoxidase [Bradyrhizobium sp. LHD-71]
MIAPAFRLAPMLCVGVLLNLGTAFATRADVIIDWNAKAEAIAVDKRMLPPANARGMAIMHVAMFEAVNAIERRYSTYRLSLTADRNASKDAAAAAAAYAVLVALHPEQEKSLTAHLVAALQQIPEAETKASAIALGTKAATEILAWRANDGANAVEGYRPHTTAGLYVPTVIPVSSTYGRVVPWAMSSGSQFRPLPPPSLTSAKWARDVNEVREFGVRANSKRSAEQTDVARFWFVTGPQAWNPIVRQLAAMRKLDVVDSARLFALVAIATDDAFIAVFDAKYHYNFWRPITAIRNADLGNNPGTPRDGAWLPLGDTPMHPEYPCAHCITTMAAAAVLQTAFGNDIPEVSMTSPTAPGVTRRWTRLQDYADEVAIARIYAGFHYRFSNGAAQDMGRDIAKLVIRTKLQRLSASVTPKR